MNTSRKNEIDLFSNIFLKSKELEILKAQYQSLSQRKIVRSVSQDIVAKNSTIQVLKRKAEIYQRDLKEISVKVTKTPFEENELENQVKELRKKLALLEKENHRLCLTSSKPILPKINLPNIKAEVEDTLRQVKQLKALIKDIEDQLEQNPKESQKLQSRFEELQKNHYTLQEEIGDYIKKSPNQKYLSLQRKLEAITNSWKNNIVKYEHHITELEAESDQLKNEYMHLNAASFKKAQQQRLLKMSYDEINLKKDDGKLSVRPDVDHPGVSFMYKPSVKTLYNI
ncbi:hypothetical protein SteCoe_170 [Stentor coeruleus]|uniref:DUF4201 domain-containing protein n=1 Tax=Stentor coeruleus TaxID=5963 RepID=A0A1R2D4M2_9CILI|nr:hypothetical protein SteCoe_170 [Stentor coeruleus]